MKIEIGGGGKGLDGLMAALAARHADEGEDNKFKPATMVDIRGLLEGMNQTKFKIGDIVQLRDYISDHYKWPKADDKCIVTQLLDTPYRSGESTSTECGLSKDFGVAFTDQTGHIFEFLYDSRHFVKVGSIYDPVVTPDGEELAVE